MNFFFTGGLAVLLLLGLPVAFTLGLLAVAGMFFFNGGLQSFIQIPIISYKSLDDFTITALPMYVLMSQVLVVSGVGKDLYEMASRWFRHLPGGLAIATIFCCTIFSAISGSSVATVVTVGTVALPEMIRRGYAKRDVLGLLAAGGTLGILIPPSIPMILFGSVTGESVGKLFIAGIVPGIILTLLFMLFAVSENETYKRRTGIMEKQNGSIQKGSMGINPTYYHSWRDLYRYFHADRGCSRRGCIKFLNIYTCLSQFDIKFIKRY